MVGARSIPGCAAACVVAALVGCTERGGASSPDPGAAPAQLDASVPADPTWEASEAALQRSLAKLEALRRQAEPPDAGPAHLALRVEVREPDGPLPPTGGDAARPQRPDAGSAAQLRRWAEVVRLARGAELAPALEAARLAWAQDGLGLSPAGKAALVEVARRSGHRALVPWDADCDASVEALDRLPQTDPDARSAEALLWTVLAQRAVASHDAARARRLARRALDLDDTQTEAFDALAQAAYVESDFDQAQSFWERAARASPHPERARTYRERLERLAKERASMGTARKVSEHFAVTYDPRRDEDAARLALEHLERARKDVGALFDVYPDHLLTIVLYADESFERVKHTSWAAGFYDGKLRMPSGGATSQSSRFKVVLYHEYAHGLFERATKEGRPAAPGWLNEGLAELADHLADPVPLGGCRVGHTFPLRSLPAAFGALDRQRAHPAYLQARHAVERLRETYGDARLRGLLSELARARDFDRAFEATFGVPYAKWAADFDRESGH